MISFILNKGVVTTNSPPGQTLLDFIRYEKQLKGTKIGCREGDCGACTVLVGDFHENEMRYRSMTSCLLPLNNIHGKHVLSIEGINMEKLSPVQELIISHNGTQCGFCTTGFVISLTGFTLTPDKPEYPDAIKAIDGNICRCTGYKSIERAAGDLCDILKNRPAENRTEWLINQGFLPEYLKEIPDRLRQLKKEYASPVTLNGPSKTYFIGGGTDLMVQKPEVIKRSPVTPLLENPDLKKIQVDNYTCRIGATVTITEFEESTVIQNLFPDLNKYMKLVSSSPIRNMATIGGNIVNASPIGDMTIFFLALDSTVILKNGNQQRELPLKEFFLGYKELDKTGAELIESIQFKTLSKQTFFNFEKVCKRTHLDIASVNTACSLRLNENDHIAEAHLAAGGVAPIPLYLNKSSAFLQGKKMDTTTLIAFLQIMDQEIAPISDARGSAEYKRLLLRQLVLSHFMKFFGPIETLTRILKP